MKIKRFGSIPKVKLFNHLKHSLGICTVNVLLDMYSSNGLSCWKTGTMSGDCLICEKKQYFDYNRKPISKKEWLEINKL